METCNFIWLRYDETNGPVVQEAGELDVNRGFETIILRSKLNLHNIEVLPVRMTPIF